MVFVLVLFWVLVNNGNAKFQNVEETLNKIQKFYENIKTMKGEFIQQTTFLDGNKEIRKGRFWIKKPGKFRWEYLKPEKFFIICDGSQVYVYYVEEKEVFIYSSQEIIPSQLILSFINGEGNIKKNLKVKNFEIISKEIWKITFIPLSQDVYFQELTLTIDINTGEVKNFSFINTTGEIVEVEFKNLKYNAKCKNELFTFALP